MRQQRELLVLITQSGGLFEASSETRVASTGPPAPQACWKCRVVYTGFLCFFSGCGGFASRARTVALVERYPSRSSGDTHEAAYLSICDQGVPAD